MGITALNLTMYWDANDRATIKYMLQDALILSHDV
jgi:hypothetical protein